MNPETKAILDALLESRRILEAQFGRLESKVEALDTKVEALDSKVDALDTRVQALETKLDAVAADVVGIKEQLADMDARDRYLIQKTGELESELFVVKRRQKA